MASSTRSPGWCSWLALAPGLAIVVTVATMYLGSIAETRSTDAVFGPPTPTPRRSVRRSRCPTLAGQAGASCSRASSRVPPPAPGCKLVAHGPIAVDHCRLERPALLPLPDGRLVACHFPHEVSP